jgi:hypothetical protein
VQPPASLGAGAGGAQAVAFSSRGARLAVGFHGGDLFVLDAASCAVLGRVELRPAPSVELAWAPDGAALLASNGGAARVVVALEDGGEVQVVGPAVPADARAPGGVERAACVLGSWAVCGVHAEDGSRDGVTVVRRGGGGGGAGDGAGTALVAAGDDFGRVALFEFPRAANAATIPDRAIAHRARVGALAFVPGGGKYPHPSSPWLQELGRVSCEGSLSGQG